VYHFSALEYNGIIEDHYPGRVMVRTDDGSSVLTPDLLLREQLQQLPYPLPNIKK
jgi:hypothetical protein